MGAVLLASQRARLPLPWFCSEGSSNFLAESQTYWASSFLPPRREGNPASGRQKSLFHSLWFPGRKEREGDRQYSAHLGLSRGSGVEVWPAPLGSSPRCDPQAPQQGRQRPSCLPAAPPGRRAGGEELGLNRCCFIQGVFLAAQKIHPVPRGLN